MKQSKGVKRGDLGLVKAVDIEGLIKKYVEENSLDRADALYLLSVTDRSTAAKVLRTRYGIAGPLTSVLDDLKVFGLTEITGRTEDTKEDIKDVIGDPFIRLCLDKIKEAARSNATTLSCIAKKTSIYNLRSKTRIFIKYR